MNMESQNSHEAWTDPDDAPELNEEFLKKEFGSSATRLFPWRRRERRLQSGSGRSCESN